MVEILAKKKIKMTKQEQIKKGILQVMACGGEVGVVITVDGNPYKYTVGILEAPGVINVSEAIAPFCGESQVIFHRLSSLTQEITVEGETFVPIDKLMEVDGEYFIEYDNGSIYFNDECSLNVYEATRCTALVDQLHAWGFFTGDQQLFESGDLIDKLTLK